MEHDSKIIQSKVKELFNSRAQLYEGNEAVLDASEQAKHGNVYRDYIFKNIIDKYISFSRKRDIVLDYGCGIGRLSSYISSKVNKVIGVDISTNMIAVAKKINSKANISYHAIESADDLVPINLIYNKVIVCWVMQHMDTEELQKSLRVIWQNMAEDGELYLFEQISRKTKVSNELHIQRGEQDYLDILKDSGFKVSYSMPIFRSPSYALSIWQKYSNIPKFFLPLLAFIERMTMSRNAEHINYQTFLIKAIK